MADLLTHQAALVDYTELEGPTTPEGLVESCRKHHDQQPLSHSTTGSLWNYSNLNFTPCGLPCRKNRRASLFSAYAGENILTAGNELELLLKALKYKTLICGPPDNLWVRPSPQKATQHLGCTCWIHLVVRHGSLSLGTLHQGE